MTIILLKMRSSRFCYRYCHINGIRAHWMCLIFSNCLHRLNSVCASRVYKFKLYYRFHEFSVYSLPPNCIRVNWKWSNMRRCSIIFKRHLTQNMTLPVLLLNKLVLCHAAAAARFSIPKRAFVFFSLFFL